MAPEERSTTAAPAGEGESASTSASPLSAPATAQPTPFLPSLESWVGGFWSLLCLSIGTLIGGAMIATSIDAADSPIVVRLAIGAGGAAIVAAELWCACYIFLCWREALHPLALAVALRTPVLPFLLRPPLAIWWLGHFFFGIGSTLLLATTADEQADGGKALPLGVVLLFTFGFTYASQLFLALAVTTVWPDPAAAKAVWRLRFVTSLLVVLLGWLLAYAAS